MLNFLNYYANNIQYLQRFDSTGFFNVSMENIRTTWDISGHVVNDRWVVEHFKTAPTISSMKIWFSDLFNGNEELSKCNNLSMINEPSRCTYTSRNNNHGNFDDTITIKKKNINKKKKEMYIIRDIIEKYEG